MWLWQIEQLLTKDLWEHIRSPWKQTFIKWSSFIRSSSDYFKAETWGQGPLGYFLWMWLVEGKWYTLPPSGSYFSLVQADRHLLPFFSSIFFHKGCHLYILLFSVYEQHPSALSVALQNTSVSQRKSLMHLVSCFCQGTNVAIQGTSLDHLSLEVREVGALGFMGMLKLERWF